MTIFLLDTNIVSYAIKLHPKVMHHLTSVPITSLAISSITEAETLYGLALRPRAEKLKRAVDQFLKRVAVLSWDRNEAKTYGELRARLKASGKALSVMDMLIAAHAASIGATLVTCDKAYSHVAELDVVDWTV